MNLPRCFLTSFRITAFLTFCDTGLQKASTQRKLTELYHTESIYLWICFWSRWGIAHGLSAVEVTAFAFI